MYSLLPHALLLAALLLAQSAFAELRDPTRPSGFYQSVSTDQEEIIQPDSLQLQAIFYHPDNPGALINGRRYTVDDQVGDATIVSIQSDTVLLTGLEGEKELRLMVPTVKQRHEEKPDNAVEGSK